MRRLKELIGKTDIYLLDQILKGRFLPQHRILDAGCGTGRNLYWFARNGFSSLYGIDQNADRIKKVATDLSFKDVKFSIGKLEKLPYGDDFFDAIVCNAVLHFAESKEHFFEMVSELWRVLKNQGIIFIRMTNILGLESLVRDVGNGNYLLPDGTKRFLLTNAIVEEWKALFPIEWIEPLKTVNVNNERAMSTLVLRRLG